MILIGWIGELHSACEHTTIALWLTLITLVDAIGHSDDQAIEALIKQYKISC
jgi:hypothetical protein